MVLFFGMCLHTMHACCDSHPQRVELSVDTLAGISVLAGSGIGGGTRINWCACFQTPPHVRSEWAAQHGLDFADSPRYTRALDVICDKLAIHTHPRFEADASAVALQTAMNVCVHCNVLKLLNFERLAV